MKAEVEYIDPAYAKQALEKNAGNRTISQATVERYAKMMVEEHWLPTGETVKFTADGRLLDGQHRLLAVIHAQRTVAMLVARGVPEASFAVLDTGRARSIADVLGLEGYRHAATLSGIARRSYAYASGLSFSFGADIPTLLAFAKAHPRMQEVAKLVDEQVRSRVYPKVSLATVLFLATDGGHHVAEAAAFVDGLASGVGLWRGDPRLTLREWRMNHQSNHRVLTTDALFSGAARAWNAFAEGRELMKLSKHAGKPTRHNTSVVGFDRARFEDVPDLYEEVVRKWTSNLPKPLATAPLDLPKAERNA